MMAGATRGGGCGGCAGGGVSVGVGVSVSQRIEDLEFVQSFVRMCADGYEKGWHERNGGNASYRLSDDDKDACRALLAKADRIVGFASAASSGVDEKRGAGQGERSWTSLSKDAPGLAGEWLLITAAGSHMRDIADDPSRCLGLIELSDAGDAYRIVWGFEGGGRPTSELLAHLLIQMSLRESSDAALGKSSDATLRVFYHCHPAEIVALTHVISCDARTVTRTLWSMMTECVMVFPRGIGVVECLAPGGDDLAYETAKAMSCHDAVIWEKHGLAVAGASFDEAFGLAHVIVKAAQIYQCACLMRRDSERVLGIPPEKLLSIARELGVSVNPDYLG